MVEKMGSRIRDLRMLRGLTQEELAFLLYRKKNTISQYESDEVDMRASVIEQLAEVLRAEPGYFFGQIDKNIEAEKKSREGRSGMFHYEYVSKKEAAPYRRK